MQRIAEIRKERGISQKALSEATGIPQGYLSELENGKKNNPSIFKLFRIATALGCSVDDLVEKPTN